MLRHAVRERTKTPSGLDRSKRKLISESQMIHDPLAGNTLNERLQGLALIMVDDHTSIRASPFVTTTSRIAPAAQLSFQIAARVLSQTPWPMWMLDRTCAPPLQGVRPSRSYPGQPLQKRPESAQRDGFPSTLSLRLNPHPALRTVRHQRPETN